MIPRRKTPANHTGAARAAAPRPRRATDPVQAVRRATRVEPVTRTLKVLVLGPPGVGKASLANRFVTGMPPRHTAFVRNKLHAVVPARTWQEAPEHESGLRRHAALHLRIQCWSRSLGNGHDIDKDASEAHLVFLCFDLADPVAGTRFLTNAMCGLETAEKAHRPQEQAWHKHFVLVGCRSDTLPAAVRKHWFGLSPTATRSAKRNTVACLQELQEHINAFHAREAKSTEVAYRRLSTRDGSGSSVSTPRSRVRCVNTAFAVTSAATGEGVFPCWIDALRAWVDEYGLQQLPATTRRTRWTVTVLHPRDRAPPPHHNPRHQSLPTQRVRRHEVEVSQCCACPPRCVVQ